MSVQKKTKTKKEKRKNIKIKRELLIRKGTEFSTAIQAAMVIRMKGEPRRQLVKLMKKILSVSIELDSYKDVLAKSYGAKIVDKNYTFPDTDQGRLDTASFLKECDTYFSVEENLKIKVIDIDLGEDYALTANMELSLDGVINFL